MEQRLGDTLTAEAIYRVNFTQQNKISVLSLHHNGSNTLLDNATKIDQFKAKNSEMKDYALCLGNYLKLIPWKKQD